MVPLVYRKCTVMMFLQGFVSSAHLDSKALSVIKFSLVFFCHVKGVAEHPKCMPCQGFAENNMVRIHRCLYFIVVLASSPLKCFNCFETKAILKPSKCHTGCYTQWLELSCSQLSNTTVQSRCTTHDTSLYTVEFFWYTTPQQAKNQNSRALSFSQGQGR